MNLRPSGYEAAADEEKEPQSAAIREQVAERNPDDSDLSVRTVVASDDSLDVSCEPDLNLREVVEPALARALLLAAEAGRWAIVQQIASELGARRLASERRESRQGGLGATEPALAKSGRR
ncbi:hypothetical protein ACFL5O_00015 [Myxococcota bacterium]